MLKSMTGYGRHEDTLGGRHITFEIKAVNHKYFEFSSRMTRGYLFLEDKIKSYVQSKVSRGKIDVFLQIETLESADLQVLVNHSLAKEYINALNEIKDTYSLNDEVTLSLVARHSDIFTVHKAPEDEDEIVADVLKVADVAINNFIAMREKEGEKLKDDVMSRADHIMEIITAVETESPETISAYEARLRAKIEDVLQDRQVDEQRLLTEVAIFSDKVAVDEETVRLRSHFKQLEELVKSSEPIGRKMDFLVQEMNREANTIGSKSVNSKIAHMIVEVKSEIEKIREQVQNIE